MALPALSSCASPGGTPDRAGAASGAAPAGRDTGSPAPAGGRVRLHVTDAAGSELDLAGVRRVQSNGAGTTGYDDVLLDSSTLEAVAAWPLEADDDGAPVLHLPDGGPWTLCLSWPTSHGYSALMADLPGPGEHDLAELAARTLHTRQASRLVSTAVTASDQATDLRAAAQAELDACSAAADWCERGRHAHAALEAAASAQLVLDLDLAVGAPADAVVGVTWTRVPSTAEVDALLGPGGPGSGGRDVAVRLVVDDESDAAEMAGWSRTVARLHAGGAIAVGQVCDSHAMAALDDDAWDRRVESLLASLPEVDAWEVGNELGGSWLGEGSVGKVTRAARAVRAAGPATTLLTLYHQLGQDTAETSTFTVAATLVDDELRELVDVVGLSVYPQWHPLGTAADRVMETLTRAFAGSRVAVTELGYGGADLDDGPWWFGSRADTQVARAAVARHVTAAALGREGAWGAPFWWYYLEDEAGGCAPNQQTAGGCGGQGVAAALADAAPAC